MSYKFKLSDEFKFLVEHAARALGEPCRPLVLDRRIEAILRKMVRLETRTGIDAELPVQMFHSGKRGHTTSVGLEKYRLTIDGQEICLVRVYNGYCGDLPMNLQDPWVVPSAHYGRLYRLLRQIVRRQVRETDVAPVMAADQQDRLFNNTVGFLQRGQAVLKRYGVPQKRGVLLVGEPGCGKTMACRWLFAQCRRLGFEWRHVDADEYESARLQNNTRDLFTLAKPGLILFDDFDLGMRDRERVGPSPDHTILLSELDGVEQREGVVFLFTTNARLADLDSAFLRRGRMDQVIHFPRPDAELRRRLILEFWHPDIVAAIEVERVVAQTEGRSFADLGEIKKLLALHYLDTGCWDFDWAWNALQSDAPTQPRKIGFGDASSRRQHAGSKQDAKVGF